jgi:3-deoxy-D-manno-octulosonate 8-phosphate phosphatase (KDO 8-P phosphatase)
MMKENTKEKLSKIKMLLLDVDGVLTDGRITYHSEGKELISFDVHDGYGITNAMKHGIIIGIITGRNSEAVKRRAIDLGITEFFPGSLNKTEPYEQIKIKYKLSDENIAYVGDDILDIPLLQKVGFPVATSNARREAKRYAEYITESPGGRGAVREVTDMILQAQNKI